MGRSLNPYYTPPDPVTPALSGLMKAFMSGPSAYERDYLQARSDAARVKAAKDRAEIDALGREQAAQASLGEWFSKFVTGPTPEASRPDPSFTGPMPPVGRGEFIRQGIGKLGSTGVAAGLKPSGIADLFRFYSANGGAPDDTVRNSIIGAGGGDAQMKAFMIPGMSEADQRIATLGQAAYGATETQERGKAFAGVDPRLQAMAVGPSRDEAAGTLLGENFTKLDSLSDPQRKALGAEPGNPPTAKNYITPDRVTGLTRDGMTDLQTGEKLPKGVQLYSNVANEVPTSVRAKQLETEKSRKRFTALLDYTAAKAQDPSNFGFPGFIKGVAQDSMALLGGVSEGLGYESQADAVMDARKRVISNKGLSPGLLGGLFDPGLGELQTAADLLVFSAAETLANQQGRSVSDKDIEMFRKITGDPSSFFSHKDKFLAKLQTMREIVDAYAAADEGTTSPTGSTNKDPLGIR